MTVSEFEFHTNQGLIGYKILLEYINRNLDYYNGIFYQYVQRSLVLNQEIFEYFE